MNEPMTIEELRERYSYNAETGSLHIAKKLYRSIHKVGDRVGYIGDSGYEYICIKGRNYVIHRAIWAHFYGEWPKIKLDHINRIRTDNRIENLRLADNSQNNANQSLRSDNKSGKKGVIWLEARQKWFAQIGFRGKRKSGYFVNLEDAAKFYDENAKKLQEEFFSTNAGMADAFMAERAKRMGK